MNSMMRHLFVFSVFQLALLAVTNAGAAESDIVMGTTAALSGPRASIGEALILGVRIRFEAENAKGGINSRKLKLITMDDGYQAPRALENAKKMVDSEKVFGFISCMGTGMANALMPYMETNGIPFLFPHTGAETTRDSRKKHVFNSRVGYPDEIKSLVDFSVKNLKVKEIGAFVQNDAFGTSIRAGAAKALAQHGLKMIGEVSHAVGDDLNVTEAVQALKKSGAKAVILGTIHKPAIAFVKKAHELDYHPIFLAISLVGSEDTAAELGEIGKNIYVSEVLPLASDSSYEIVRNFRRDAKATGLADGGTLNNSNMFEAYVDADIFVRGLKMVSAPLTRVKLGKALESINDVDIGGVRISFKSQNRQYLQRNYLVKVNAGSVEEIK